MKIFYLLFITITLNSHLFSQDVEYAKTIVKTLASEEFKGRGYVENGDKIAANFIEKEFKNIGLLPIIKNSFFQKFNVSVNTFPNNIYVKIDDTELHLATDYLIESSSPSVKGTFQLLKISRKEIDTEEKFTTLLKKTADYFIFIDNNKNENETKEIKQTIDSYIKFLQYSNEINIKGIILYSQEKLTWSNSTFQNVRPIVVVNKSLDVSKINNIEIIVESEFIKNHKTQNIAGQIKGSSLSDSMIVITAHYDHLGKLGKNIFFPGANDNASGIAMLLNLAKHYSINKPKYTTVFIALAAEEIGLLGAIEFTENPIIDLEKIKFLLNFDLAGTGDEGIKIVNGSIFKNKFDLITQINQEHNLLPKIDIRGEACNSDHCMFYKKGVPCFYIYTQGGIQAYHDIYDKYETLPFTEFYDYYKLMILFFDSL